MMAPVSGNLLTTRIRQDRQDPAGFRQDARTIRHRRRRPLAAATRLAFNIARLSGARAMPLHFSDEEMSLLIDLSGPIAPAARPAFMQEVANELAASGQGRGVGAVHRVGRVVQRRFFDTPQLPNAGKMARA
jgi:hypothetical protein